MEKNEKFSPTALPFKVEAFGVQHGDFFTPKRFVGYLFKVLPLGFQEDTILIWFYIIYDETNNIAKTQSNI